MVTYHDEFQHIDNEYFRSEDEVIMKCYEHFSQRYKERYKPKNLSFGYYWYRWICILKGSIVSKDDLNMIRYLGNYNKDQFLYKIVYCKISKFDIWIPLTIYKIEDSKKKNDLYRGYLKMKNNSYYL